MSNIKYVDEVHEHIALSIRQYPSLYKCRTFVLHHMFCVNGNGYRWEEGRLICDESEPPYKTATAMIKAKNKMSASVLRGLERFADKSPKSLITEAYKDTILRFRFENAYNLALTPWTHKDLKDIWDRSYYPDLYSEHIYPMSTNYTKLDNVPDDVTPAWLSAAREMIKEILAAPVSAHVCSAYTDEQNKKVYKDNIKLVKKAAKDLDSRFGKMK